ncbi:MAG: response regulator [Candidatus Eremiobacteraeota bacterium]|nr:response regulator [Candidatus Eremiobacteraeota bacterium]
MKAAGQIHVGPTWPDEVPLPEALEAQVQRTVADFDLAALRIWFRLDGKYEPTPLLSWSPDGMLRGGFDARAVSSIVRAQRDLLAISASTPPAIMTVDFERGAEGEDAPEHQLKVIGVALAHGGSLVGYLECHAHTTIGADLAAADQIRSRAAELARIVAEIRVPTSTAAKTRGHVLLVEDDAEQRKFVQSNLEQFGFKVSVASNGAIALVTAESEHPDVILLDWAMPVMDGLTTCRRLKAQPSTASIPVMMIANRVDVDDKVLALETGVQDFLVKPLHPKELSARVAQLVNWRRQFLVQQTAAPAEALDESQFASAIAEASLSTADQDHWMLGLEAARLGKHHEALANFVAEAEQAEKLGRYARAALAYRSASVTAGEIRDRDAANRYLRLAGKMYFSWAENDDDPAHVRDAYVNAARCFLMAGNLKLAKKSVDYATSIDAVLADDRPTPLQ